MPPFVVGPIAWKSSSQSQHFGAQREQVNLHLEPPNSMNLLIDLHRYGMVMDIVAKGRKVFGQSYCMDQEDVRVDPSVDLEVEGAAGLAGFDHRSRGFSIRSLALSGD